MQRIGKMRKNLETNLRRLDGLAGPAGDQPPSKEWVEMFNYCLNLDRVIEQVENRTRR